MQITFARREVALAVLALIGSASLAPATSTAAGKAPGKYVTGDFHNHTTCSDGSISMQKLVKKVTDKVDTPWGLDWFVQAGYGGNGNRNCTLVEDSTLSTPAYQFFGIGRIDARSKALTVSLHGIDGQRLYSVELPVEA